jgi:ATP-dependent DNA helicase RecG
MKESETEELKKSTSELKEAIISIASILNKHQQGALYFGIERGGEVVGQTVTENTLRDISRAISEHIEPKIFPKINEITLEGKSCIHVEFAGNNLPYYAYGRAYMRVGDEDR